MRARYSSSRSSSLNRFRSISASTDLQAELETALSLLGSGSPDLGELSLDEEALFAGLAEGSNLRLEEIVALAEQYPGLKITISF